MAEKLLDQMRRIIRVKHYSYRTEQAYLQWARRFYSFFTTSAIRRTWASWRSKLFLTHLAVDRHVAAATQNQALNGILFLYREVLEIELPWLSDVTRAKRPVRVPLVLSRSEVRAVLATLQSPHDLIVRLLYGSGLRVGEATRLRIKDLDFKRRSLIVRDGKGAKDRITVLPDSVVPALKLQIEKSLAVGALDRRRNRGGVILPHALDRKYPNARFEDGWQFVFPARNLSMDPRSEKLRRHHVFNSSVQRSVKYSAQKAGLHKPVTCHNVSPLLCDAYAGERI